MDHKAKAPVIMLVMLIIISLGLAGGVFYLFQKERLKNSQLQEQLEDINTRLRATEVKFEESKKKISELQLDLQEATSQIGALNNDLKQERASREEALSKIDMLRSDLEQQKKLRSDLENKFNQAQQEARNTQDQLKTLESEKTDLEEKVKDLEAKTQKIELGKIVVSPAAGAQKAGKQVGAKKPSGLVGQVLVVNKDYDFAVISLGSKDGISLGQEFSVYHDGKYLGNLKVEKLHDAMAAAGFVSADIKNKISEGDKVVQKNK